MWGRAQATLNSKQQQRQPSSRVAGKHVEKHIHAVLVSQPHLRVANRAAHGVQGPLPSPAAGPAAASCCACCCAALRSRLLSLRLLACCWRLLLPCNWLLPGCCIRRLLRCCCGCLFLLFLLLLRSPLLPPLLLAALAGRRGNGDRLVCLHPATGGRGTTAVVGCMLQGVGVCTFHRPAPSR